MVDDVRNDSVDIWWMCTLGRALSKLMMVIGSRRCLGKLLNAMRGAWGGNWRRKLRSWRCGVFMWLWFCTVRCRHALLRRSSLSTFATGRCTPIRLCSFGRWRRILAILILYWARAASLAESTPNSLHSVVANTLRFSEEDGIQAAFARVPMRQDSHEESVSCYETKLFYACQA